MRPRDAALLLLETCEREIEPAELVARTRYVMGREFEGLHLEYLTILKKLGYKVSKPKE